MSKAVLGSRSHPARASTMSCPELKSRQRKSDIIKVCLGAGELMGIGCPAMVTLKPSRQQHLWGGLRGDTGCLSGFFMKPSGNIKSYKLEMAKWVKSFATTPDESDPPKLRLETSTGTGCPLISTCVEWQMCKHIQ